MGTRAPTTAEFFVMATVCAIILVLLASALLPESFSWASLEGGLIAVGILIASGAIPFCRDVWPPERLDDDSV